MFKNRVKEILKSGKTAWGGAISDDSDLAAKATIDTGIDFLWIDLEHRAYGVSEIRWIPILCRRKNCVPMIRVAGLDSQLIKKALDSGASAVMIPQINNPEEAIKSVQYSKYPPEGTRGISPFWTAFEDVSWDDYLPAANQETMVVVQIESAEGIRNIEAIANVPGVDVLFLGPTDTSAALGHIGNIDHPEVQSFIAEFPSRVAPSGKACGITYFSFEECKRAHDQGYRFIASGALLNFGKQAFTSNLNRLRNLESSS